MTRGTSGKLRVIVYGLLACLMIHLGWVVMEVIALAILGFNMPEAMFGDAIERKQNNE